MSKKLKKIECEICGCKDIETLHKHHIIERTKIDTDNHPMNLAIICSCCHNKVHAGTIEIIGIYPSTKLPYRRILVFKINGKTNVPGISKPFYNPKPAQFSVPFVEEEDHEKKT